MSFKFLPLAALLSAMLAGCGGGGAGAPDTGVDAVAAPEVSAASLTAMPAASQRAMWSWYDADVRTLALRKSMLNFAVSKGINVVYLHSESLLSDNPAALTSFIKLAAARGIAVELLFGAPEWALAANHATALALAQRAYAFIGSLTGVHPVGLHFDVEPHALPEWASQQEALGNQLVDLYRELARAKPPGLYLHADIALGYAYLTLARDGQSKTLSQWLIEATDRTTVMAYRDVALGADGIVGHAAHPVGYAATLGKLAVVGVETACNAELPKVTFCEEGAAAMQQQLDAVAAYFSGGAGGAGFGGFAIHDYRNFRQLK